MLHAERLAVVLMIGQKLGNGAGPSIVSGNNRNGIDMTTLLHTPSDLPDVPISNASERPHNKEHIGGTVRNEMGGSRSV